MPLFRKKKPAEDDEIVDMDARSPVSGLRYKDIAILGQMAAMGADLNQPRNALYYLYFADRARADDAAARATEAGYRTTVNDPHEAYPDQWGLVCERDDAIIDVPGARAADDLFQGLADELGGEFDGWEAAAVP